MTPTSTMLQLIPFINSYMAHTKKIVWLTDLHLDAAKQKDIYQLVHEMNKIQPDLILVGGDTSNGHIALYYLLALSKMTKKDIYFVLGNHEFYHSSIARTRMFAFQTTQCHPHLHYMTKEHLVELNSETVLIGHDGWSDARAGHFMNSTVTLHDYRLIQDLKNLSKPQLQMKLHRLGSQAAIDIEKKLKKCFETYANALILTHTPPFQAACIYNKRISDDNWAPHFVCKVLGDQLVKIMQKHPNHRALVLCGHAHHAADIEVLPNLRVIVGESLLGSPKIQAVLSI